MSTLCLCCVFSVLTVGLLVQGQTCDVSMTRKVCSTCLFIVTSPESGGQRSPLESDSLSRVPQGSLIFPREFSVSDIPGMQRFHAGCPVGTCLMGMVCLGAVKLSDDGQIRTDPVLECLGGFHDPHGGPHSFFGGSPWIHETVSHLPSHTHTRTHTAYMYVYQCVFIKILNESDDVIVFDGGGSCPARTSDDIPHL